MLVMTPQTQRKGTPEAIAVPLGGDPFDSLGDASQQMRIVHKAVRKHSKAIMRRDNNVVMVTAGYRVRRSAQTHHELHPEPCVICVVREKWPSSENPDGKAFRVPARLPLSIRTDGATLEMGVPTDVQPLAWFSGATTQYATGIEVETISHPGGAVACAVRFNEISPPQWFALSALHVLSPFPMLNSAPNGGVSFASFEQAGNVVGQSTQWGGMLTSKGVSFDAQLATATPAWLNHTFAGLSLGNRPYLRSRAELDAIASTSSFLVLAPGIRPNHPNQTRELIIGQFTLYASSDFSIQYGASGNGTTFPVDIRHAELIVLTAEAGAATSEPGDSGSAVIATRDGEAVFVGMLIAGPQLNSPDRRMFVLPAWRLFDLKNWTTKPDGAKSMTPTFMIP